MHSTPGDVLGSELVNRRLVTLHQTNALLLSLAHLWQSVSRVSQKDLGRVAASNMFVLPEWSSCSFPILTYVRYICTCSPYPQKHSVFTSRAVSGGVLPLWSVVISLAVLDLRWIWPLDLGCRFILHFLLALQTSNIPSAAHGGCWSDL